MYFNLLQFEIKIYINILICIIFSISNKYKEEN